jgi:lambda family phage portal protein
MIDRIKSFFAVASAAPVVRASARPYESGAVGPRRVAGWNPPQTDGASVTASNAVIRRRARAAYRNDGVARAAIDALVSDIVGYGIFPRSRAADETTRSAVQDLFSRWTEEADATGSLDFYGLQGQIVRTMLIDGECFVRLRPRLPEDRLSVPIQIEVLPAESVPEELTDDSRRIRQGIEFSPVGARIAYYFRAPGSAETSRVPAGAVLHFYRADVPGQIRGTSWLASALVRLRSLDQMQDAVIVRQGIANLLVATVTSQASADAANPLTGDVVPDVDGAPTLQLQPGILQTLDAGEALNFSTPPDPPQGYSEFITFELRIACASLGIPVQVVTGDWGSANDRIARTILAAHRRSVMAIQHTLVIPQLKKFWRAWAALAVTSKAIPATGIDRALLCTWSPQGWSYVHPVQDIDAIVKARRAGLMSRSAAAAEQGEDIEQIDAEIAADQARADKLGLRLDSDPRHDVRRGD